MQQIARLPALYVTGQKYERQLIGEGCKITVLSHTHTPTHPLTTNNTGLQQNGVTIRSISETIIHEHLAKLFLTEI